MIYRPQTLSKSLDNVIIGPEMGVAQIDAEQLRYMGFASAESLYDATDREREKPAMKRAVAAFLELLDARRAWRESKIRADVE